MDKFRINPDRTVPAIMELLMQILANQHMLKDVLLDEISRRTGEELEKLQTMFANGSVSHKREVMEFLLDRFGRLDIDDLTS
jgi:hypothetical protein